MSKEGFNKPETATARPLEREEQENEELGRFQESLRHSKGIDFSPFLGEGFDAEYFADKLATLPPVDESFKAWNEFLEEDEGGKFQARKIEISIFDSILRKILGESSAPMLFPVFIKAVQDCMKNRGIPADHVTPERMERFYQSVTAGG